MEFDHLFITASDNAPEAELLLKAGFCEGSSNKHPGQGTANRRFFFDNAFIELLYVDNLQDLTSPLTTPVRLHERLCDRDPGTSPFGLCFRPSGGAAVDGQHAAPFDCWQYHPEYLPEHLHVDIANTPLTEPMWFYLSFGGRPDQAAPDRQENRAHENGASAITSIRIAGHNPGDLSDAANAITKNTNTPRVTLDNSSADHLIEIEFDFHQQGKTIDCRPRLPLLLRL